MSIKKGNICLIDFEPSQAGKMGKRPAIILSDNQDLTLFKTVVVVPLSNLIIKDNKPYRYFISKRQRLKKDSDACIYEIRALSKSRIGAKIANISTAELDEIRQALCDLL